MAAVAFGSIAPSGLSINEDDLTVEQYLEKQFAGIIDDFKAHTAFLINKLRLEYEEGVKKVNQLMIQNRTDKKLCVNLRVVSGPHLGQRFRLEPTAENNDDVFKIGRSTGKLFKEKGVSLYKDKETSTTHAKIELRNGQAFIVDVESTNGTLLNNELMEPYTPLRLKDGDIIALGATELAVHLSEVADDQDGSQS